MFSHKIVINFFIKQIKDTKGTEVIYSKSF